jgi:hypothetical protein
MQVEEKEREFNQEFLVGILARVDWDAFLAAAATVGPAFVSAAEESSASASASASVSTSASAKW